MLVMKTLPNCSIVNEIFPSLFYDFGAIMNWSAFGILDILGICAFLFFISQGMLIIRIIHLPSPYIKRYNLTVVQSLIL